MQNYQAGRIAAEVNKHLRSYLFQQNQPLLVNLRFRSFFHRTAHRGILLAHAVPLAKKQRQRFHRAVRFHHMETCIALGVSGEKDINDVGDRAAADPPPFAHATFELGEALSIQSGKEHEEGKKVRNVE